MSTEDWIKVLTGVGGLVAFVAAIWQYRGGERWKRVQFVGQELRAMKETPHVANVAIMLDWSSRKVRLYPERESVEEQYVNVSQRMLASALRVYSEGTPFDENEARIRDNFDTFLDYLEQFQQFIDTKLIKPASFKPLLVYWVDLIAHPSEAMKDDETGSALWTYIKKYKFRCAERFLRSLGVAIPIDAKKR